MVKYGNHTTFNHSIKRMEPNQNQNHGILQNTNKKNFNIAAAIYWVISWNPK